MLVALVLLGACLVPAPSALAQSQGPVLFVAPTCLPRGATARVVVLGAGWAPGPVTLSRVDEDGTTAPVGTATARTSPAGIAGSFSITITVTATATFAIRADQDDSETSRSDSVAVPTGCRPQVSVRPPCLKAPGTVQVNGTGFPAGRVQIQVDPFGNAEAASQFASVDATGAFAATATIAVTGAAVPVVVSLVPSGATNGPQSTRTAAFVDPCPPDPTTSTTRRAPPDPGPGTTAPQPGPTTTTGAPPPADPVPGVPPVIVPGPGVSAQVSISPRTIRPGRCAVLVVAAAPQALAVVARFADGPPVNGQTGPDGRAVLSVCHAHASGIPLGPVVVLFGLGAVAPTPAFTVLRVPPRPQPPLLQSGSDSRRS